ncbi:MAG TPA: tetratricopeptide repeat protein [Terriglobia bacterium]|nr:tetratricopeptide repeat protein [Terriglobia bacterium]
MRRALFRTNQFGLRAARRWMAAVCCLLLALMFKANVRSFAQARRQGPSQAPPVPQSAKQSSPQDLFNSAQQSLSRKDYGGAVTDLKELLKAAPDSPVVWFNLGYAYTGLHQYQEAVTAYQKTVALKPDLFEARLNLGILLLDLKQPNPAIEQIQKAESLKPGDPKAHLFAGRALTLQGKTAEAEKEYRQAVNLDPRLAVAQYNLGQLYLSEKQFANANDAFNKAVALNPALPGLRLDMALALQGLNQPGPAAASLEQYLAQSPGDNQARFRLARIEMQQGSNQKALDNFLLVQKSDPDFPDLNARLGDVCALLMKFPESEKYYRQALVTMSAQPDLHRALGQTLMEEKKFSEAEAEFHATLRLDPHNLDAATGLAGSVYFEKRYADAIPIFEAILKTPNPPVGDYFFLATCFDHLHVLPRALETYQRFVQLTPDKSSDQTWQAEQRIKLILHEMHK